MHIRLAAAIALALALSAGTAHADPDLTGGEPIGVHSALEYYPTEARRAGETGEVVLELEINIDGSVRGSTVQASSGFPDLDDAAEVAVKHWRYTPAFYRGRPTPIRKLVNVVFTMGSSNYLLLGTPDESDCRNTGLDANRRLAACTSVIHGLLTNHRGEVWAHRQRAGVAILLGKSDIAREDYDALLKYDANDGTAYYGRGILSYADKKYDAALADFYQAERLQPKLFAAHYFGAKAYLALGKEKEALAELDAALAIHPDDAESLFNRLWLARKYGGSAAQEVDDAARLIALAPEYAPAYLYRAEGLCRLGRCAEALTDAEKAIATDPKSEPAYRMHIDILFELDRYKDAEPDLKTWYGLAADKEPVLLKRGMMYAVLKQFDRADADFDAAIAAKPDDPDAYNYRCYARGEQGKDLDGALADCDKALSLKPNSAAILDSRGFAYFRRGDYAKAIADFDAALAIDPKIAPSLYVRGLAKLRSGDAAGGKADVDAARALSPNVSKRFDGLGIKP